MEDEQSKTMIEKLDKIIELLEKQFQMTKNARTEAHRAAQKAQEPTDYEIEGEFD